VAAACSLRRQGSPRNILHTLTIVFLPLPMPSAAAPTSAVHHLQAEPKIRAFVYPMLKDDFTLVETYKVPPSCAAIASAVCQYAKPANNRDTEQCHHCRMNNCLAAATRTLLISSYTVEDVPSDSNTQPEGPPVHIMHGKSCTFTPADSNRVLLPACSQVRLSSGQVCPSQRLERSWTTDTPPSRCANKVLHTECFSNLTSSKSIHCGPAVAAEAQPAILPA
jgi:hypothetical protein